MAAVVTSQAVSKDKDGDSQRKSSSAVHFVAGLSTGVLSACLLQPADLLKTRVQQSRNSSLGATLKTITAGPHALRQLWRGTLPSVIRTGFGSALYFSTLNALRRSALFRPSSKQSASSSSSSSSSSVLPPASNLANLSAGALARTMAGFALMPLTVIKVRYESNLYAYGSLPSTVASILRTEGIRGLFTGAGATAARDAPYAGLYVLFYEQAKRRLGSLVNTTPRGGSSVVGVEGGPPGGAMRTSHSAAVNFSSGVLAAGAATALTNPFDAVKTRLQLRPREYGNLLKAARRMVTEEGVRSLFDGLAIRMARKAMSSALAWSLYEELVKVAERRMVV